MVNSNTTQEENMKQQVKNIEHKLDRLKNNLSMLQQDVESVLVKSTVLLGLVSLVVILKVITTITGVM